LWHDRYGRLAHADAGAYTVSVDIGRHVMPPGVAVEAMLDTGFSGALTLPRTLVNRLSANGLVMHNMGKFTGVLANGSVSEYDIVFVGDVLLPPCQEFNFLAAVVTDDQAPILIGQEILSGYLSANIDYDNQRLVLEQLTPFSTRLPRCLWPSKQSPDCPQLDPGAKPFFYPRLKSAPCRGYPAAVNPKPLGRRRSVKTRPPSRCGAHPNSKRPLTAHQKRR
jgi:predicted aspartyl protease